MALLHYHTAAEVTFLVCKSDPCLYSSKFPCGFWFPSGTIWSVLLDNVFHDSVQFSCSVMSDSLRPHEPQHTRPPCPSPTPGVHPNPCSLSQWCHPTISSSVVPFSSCLHSFLASGSFPMSQLFAWGSQSIGVSASASVIPFRHPQNSVEENEITFKLD